MCKHYNLEWNFNFHIFFSFMTFTVNLFHAEPLGLTVSCNMSVSSMSVHNNVGEWEPV